METVTLPAQIRFPAHHAGAAHIPFSSADQKNLDSCAGGERCGAITKKSFGADIFREGNFFKGLASHIGAAQLQTDPHVHARLTAALGPLSSEFLGQSPFERVEIHRLLEESGSAEILAIFLGCRASLSR